MQKYWNTVQDERGNPRYGASVSVQQNGVNSSIYTDSGGLVPAANPLTTDSTRGYFEFYAAAGTYDLSIFGVGFAPYTITAGAILGLPSGDVTFTQSGTGATARTAQAKLRDIVSILDYGGVADGVTDNATAISNALTASNKVYFPQAALAYATSSTVSLSGNKKIYGDGGISQKSQITYTGSGVAVALTSNNNGIDGIAISAASATDGIKLTDSNNNVLRDFVVPTGPTRGLYLTSPTSAGCAWNSFQQFKVTGTTALQMDLSGAGFVNLNTFITGILRTSAASNGTVATLTTSHQNTFMDVDASNYGTGTVKSWNVAGTSANNKWIGGLIDTPTGTLTGFTFAAGTVANKVIGMANNATTPYSSTGTPITDQTKEMYCDQNFNFFGEINLQTPAFGTSSPGINFYDTGNNGNQYIYSNSGFIKVGLDRTTGQFWLNPANGTIIAVANTAPPAGGTAGLGVRMSSTANFGVFFGSNAPSLSAAKGSLYLRTNGSGVNDRMYVNTDGGTTWTAVTTVA